MSTRKTRRGNSPAPHGPLTNPVSSISGGSAAIHGFLYQILAHLDWAAKLAITRRDGSFDLVLEPTDGGDAIVTTGGLRIVEQYKTRAHDGTWSLNEIVQGPIADFVRAAKIRTPQDDFRFVTNGHVDHQVAFADFLKRVAQCHALSELDDVVVNSYRSVGIYTDRQLLEWIRFEVAPTRKKKKVLPNADVVFHVLSRTTLLGAVLESELVSRVEGMLRQCIPNPQAANTKRQELVGALIDDLAKGKVSINARQYLERYGVDVDRAKRLATLSNRLRALFTATTTQGSHKYALVHDVRAAPKWDLSKKPILVLSGRSGVGKTWQLLRLGYELTDRGLPCVLVSMLGDTARALDMAARTVWNDALQTSTTADISMVKQALQNSSSTQVPDPWLVVLLDGSMDEDNLRHLVDYVSRDREFRVAITLSPEAAQRLEQNYPNLVDIVRVEEFTDEELATFLGGFDIEWRELPTDLFNVLRLPLLANLYVLSGVTSFTVSPASEYELFEALWTRSASFGGSAITNSRFLRELARYINGHPDAVSFAAERALPNASSGDLTALATSGWIDIDRNAHIRFAHDRLLNWSFADAVADDIACGLLKGDQLMEALHLPWTPASRWGYTLMDVLWKLASEPHRIGHAVAILRLLELETCGIPSDVLYEVLLPTLCERALDLIAARVRDFTDATPTYYVMRTVRRVGQQFSNRTVPAQVELWAQERIRDPRRNVVNLGLAFIDEVGLSNLSDEVFKIQLRDAADLRAEHTAHTNYELSFGALKACVRSHPAWLDERIASTTDAAALGALSWQLFNLESDDAPIFWNKHRSHFTKYISTDHIRGVLSCIRRFFDQTLVAFVKNAVVTGKDFDAGTALGVLVRIDAQEALTTLDGIPHDTLRFSRSMWFRDLHRALPQQAEEWLEREFSDGTTYELFRIIERVASPRCVQVAIDAFCKAVNKRLSVQLPWLTGWQPILISMRQGAYLRSIAHTETESQLVELAKRQIDPAREWRDHLLEDSRSILVAIGNGGIQEVLGEELRKARGRSVYKALHLCPLVPWQGIGQLLEKHVAVGAGPHDDQAFISNHHAMVALAALDLEDELINAIRSSGIRGCPCDALRVRHGQRPFSSSAIGDIEQRLARATELSEDDLIRELALAALAQAPGLKEPIESAMALVPNSESIFVHGAAAALEYIPVSERLALSSGRWLGSKAQRYSINLHLQCGSERALMALLDFAKSSADKGLAAEIVARFPESGPIGEEADRVAVEIFKVAAHASACYFRVARCGGRSERELLKRRAYQIDASMLDVRKVAIQALGTVDRNEAVEAAMWLAQQSPNLDEFVALYVIRFGTDAQCLRFIEHVDDLDRAALWAHVGRAMRRREKVSSNELMKNFRTDTRLRGRKAFAAIGGWLGTQYQTDLRSRLAAEHSPSVLKTLEIADRRIIQLETLAEHLAALRTAAAGHRAALLIACLAMDEPFLLSYEDDAFWIGNALIGHPKYFQIFADEALSKLRRDWKPEE